MVRVFPFFVHSGFGIRDFHRWRHKITITRRSESSFPAMRSPRSFGWASVQVRLQLTRHGCFHLAIPIFPCDFFNGFLELLVIGIDRVDSSQLSRIVELRFLDSPLLLFVCWVAFDILDVFSGHRWSGLVVAWFFVSRAPDHLNPSNSLFHSILWTAWNRSMVPISFDRLQCSENRRFGFLATHPDVVCVLLITSMYRSGNGNDSFFGTKSRTPGSTWWR